MGAFAGENRSSSGGTGLASVPGRLHPIPAVAGSAGAHRSKNLAALSQGRPRMNRVRWIVVLSLIVVAATPRPVLAQSTDEEARLESERRRIDQDSTAD